MVTVRELPPRAGALRLVGFKLYVHWAADAPHNRRNTKRAFRIEGD
jgi:hypothetical protein